MKKILIIALNKNWVGISRLPSGLNRAGFKTYALCPRGSYLSYTKYLSNPILFPTFTYSRSKIFYILTIYAFLKFKPDMIIPGDEEATLVLYNLNTFFSKMTIFKKFALILNNSLPAKNFESIIFSKSTFLENCNDWKIPTPKSMEVNSISEAKLIAEQMHYPIVLKLDIGYGGSGVFICQSEEELIKNFATQKNHSLLKRLKILIKKLLFISISPEVVRISIQQYIKGIAGHISFCSLEGKLLAANSMLGIRTYPGSTGPSSVSQGINNQMLLQAAKTVTYKLNYNGFGSLDFIYDEAEQKFYIIELNARPTPTCHLSSEVVTYDLCSSIQKGINHELIELKKFKPFVIAMFPNERKRDPESIYLKDAYHDIPLDDQRLMDALLV